MPGFMHDKTNTFTSASPLKPGSSPMVEAIEYNFATLVSALKELDAVRKSSRGLPDGSKHLAAACEDFCTSSKRVLRSTIQSVDRMVEEHVAIKYRLPRDAIVPTTNVQSLSLPPSTSAAPSTERVRTLVLSQRVFDHWKMYCFGQRVRKTVEKRQSDMLAHLESAQKLAVVAKSEVQLVEQKECDLRDELARSETQRAGLIAEVAHLKQTLELFERTAPQVGSVPASPAKQRFMNAVDKVKTLQKLTNVVSVNNSEKVRQIQNLISTGSVSDKAKAKQVHRDLSLLSEQLGQSDTAARELAIELEKLQSEQENDKHAFEILLSEKSALVAEVSRLQQQRSPSTASSGSASNQVKSMRRMVKIFTKNHADSLPEISQAEMANFEKQMGEELLKLQADQETSQSQLASILSERDSLVSQLTRLKETEAQMRQHDRVNRAEVAELYERIKGLDQQLSKSETQRAELATVRTQLDKSQRALAELEQDKERHTRSYQERVNELSKSIKLKDQELLETKHDLESLRIELRDKTRAVDELGQENSDLLTTVARGNAERDRLTEELHREHERLRKQLHSAQSTISEKETEIGSLESAVSARTMEERNTANSRIESLTSEIDTLKSSERKLREKIHELESAVAEGRAASARLTADTAEDRIAANARIEAVTVEREALQSSERNLREKVHQLESDVADKEAEVNSLSRSLEAMKSRLANTESELAECVDELRKTDKDDKLADINSALASAGAARIALEAKVVDLTAQVEQLKATESEANQRVETSRRELREAQLLLAEKEAESDSLSRSLETARSRMSHAESSLSQTSMELVSLRSELDAARIEIAASQRQEVSLKQLQDLKAALSESRALLHKHESDSARAESALAAAIADRETAIHDLEQSLADAASLRRELAQTKAAAVARETDANHVRMELDETLQELNTMRDRYEERLRLAAYELSNVQDTFQHEQHVETGLMRRVRELESQIENLTVERSHVSERIAELESKLEAEVAASMRARAEARAGLEKQGELMREIEAGQETERQLRARIDLMDQDMNAAENEIEELQAQVELAEKLKQELDAKSAAERELRARIEEVEGAYERMQQRLDGSAESSELYLEIDTLHAQLREAEEAIKVLANDLTEAEDAGGVMKNLLGAAETDLERLVTELAAAETDRRKLELQLANQRASNAAPTPPISTAEDAKDSTRSEMWQKERAELEKRLDVATTQYSGELRVLRAQRAELETRTIHLTDAEEKWEQERAELQNRLDVAVRHHSDELLAVKAIRAELENRIARLGESGEGWQKERVELLNRLDEAAKRHSDEVSLIKADRFELETLIADLRESGEKWEAERAEMEMRVATGQADHSAELAALNIQLDRVQHQLAELEVRERDLTNECESAHMQADAFKTERGMVESKLESAVARITELERSSQQERALMESSLHRVEEDRKRLESLLAVYQTARVGATDQERLEMSVKELSGELAEADSELEKLRFELDEIKVSESDLKQKLRNAETDLMKAKDETIRLLGDMSATRSEVSAVQLEMERLRASLASMESERARLMAQVSSLQADRDLDKADLGSARSELDRVRSAQEKVSARSGVADVQLAELRAQLTEADKEILRLESELAKRELDISRLTSEKSASETRLTTAAKEWGDVESGLRQQLAAAASELGDMKRRIADRRLGLRIVPGLAPLQTFGNSREEETVASLRQAETELAQLRALAPSRANNEELMTTISKLLDEKSSLTNRLGRLEQLLESREKGKVESLQQVIKDIVTQANPSILLVPLSQHVEVDAGGSMASYVGVNKDADMCGCMITNAPLPLFEEGLYFEVRVTAATSGNPDGLTVGITTTQPWQGHPIPNTLDDIPHSWAVGYNGQTWNSAKAEWKQIAWCGKDLAVGQRVGVFVAAPPVSQLFVFVDDALACRGPARLPSCLDYPYFGLIDLLGNCESVTLLWGAGPPLAARELVAVDPKRTPVMSVPPIHFKLPSRKGLSSINASVSSIDSPIAETSKVVLPRLSLKPTVEPSRLVDPASDSDSSTARL